MEENPKINAELAEVNFEPLIDDCAFIEVTFHVPASTRWSAGMYRIQKMTLDEEKNNE